MKGEPIKTLIEQYDVQNVWFENPNYLFSFIIMVDGKPAGFEAEDEIFYKLEL